MMTSLLFQGSHDVVVLIAVLRGKKNLKLFLIILRRKQPPGFREASAKEKWKMLEERKYEIKN